MPSSDRRRPSSRDRDDDWDLPPWNPISEPFEAAPPARGDSSGAAVGAFGTPIKSTAPRESGVVLGLAVCYAVVGFIALVLSFVPLLSGTGSVPRGLILLIALQLGAFSLMRISGSEELARAWMATLICTAVLTPLLAMQVTLLREPYVALSRNSASPAMLATLVATMLLFAGAVWAVASSWQDPDEAGLLFLPIGMTVPALIGMRSTILQRPALQMLAEVMVLAAIATAVAWVLPPGNRIFVPPVAVAVEFVLLWATGRGPWFHETSGDIVRVLYSLMLAVTVILVVAVPFAAMWIKHGATKAASSPPSRPEPPAPRRTARRSIPDAPAASFSDLAAPSPRGAHAIPESGRAPRRARSAIAR